MLDFSLVAVVVVVKCFVIGDHEFGNGCHLNSLLRCSCKNKCLISSLKLSTYRLYSRIHVFMCLCVCVCMFLL